MSELFFYVISCFLILASMGVALSSSPMHSVLSLIFAFLVTSVMWIGLNAEFLGLALLFVYVGAVMVLFLFVVFMLNVNKLDGSSLLLKGLTLFGMGFLLYSVLSKYGVSFGEFSEVTNKVSNTKALGIKLYTEYWVSFELLGCVLLASMVAVIQMVDGDRSNVKRQDIGTQIGRKKEECISWMK